MTATRIHVVTNWVLSGVLLFAFGLSSYRLHHQQVQDEIQAAALPKNILVGKDVWTVYETPELMDGSRLFGETDCRNKMILYRRNPIVPAQVTILHELLHAGACHGNLPDNHHWNTDDDTVHEGIYLLSEFEGQVLRDNPELAEWLKRRDYK